MGLLSLGTPLDWDNASMYLGHVKEQGILQFLNIWNKVKSRTRDQLIWGDEIEYILVVFDDDERKVRVSLDAQDILDSLEQKIQSESSWHPEYGRKATPKVPYGSHLRDLLKVEENIIARKKLVNSLLGPNQALLTITNFPRLGCDGFTFPVKYPTPTQGPSRSLFLPSEIMNSHARFPTLTQNIRKRRGSKVAINVPIFRDIQTLIPFIEMIQSQRIIDLEKDAKVDHVYMDAMGFGMGCACLQVTFQACSVEEARKLYDQLAVITPLMLAISAGSPIFRGYFVDVDCRWNIISASVDDRTPQERGLEDLDSSKYRISKSRYDSISLYLSPGPVYSEGCCTEDDDGYPDKIPTNGNSKSSLNQRESFFQPEFNDLNVSYDEKILEQLKEGGVDEQLAMHYAHLFIRDPLVIFEELLNQDNSASSDHFENIQSTNWQTMRFKPPPPNSDIGWRVEFRSMEIQLTDTENAAFSIFVVLLTRTILKYNLNFYIPLSKVDENMQKAQVRDSVRTQSFWFRKEIMCCPKKKELYEYAIKLYQEKAAGAPITRNLSRAVSTTYSNVAENLNNSLPKSCKDCDLFTINEIMNGNTDRNFIGLIPLVRSYIALSSLNMEEFEKLDYYISIISGRCSGDLKTPASWIRDFVLRHPEYRHDSIVTDSINYDLCQTIKDLEGIEYSRY